MICCCISKKPEYEIIPDSSPENKDPYIASPQQPIKKQVKIIDPRGDQEQFVNQVTAPLLNNPFNMPSESHYVSSSSESDENDSPEPKTPPNTSFSSQRTPGSNTNSPYSEGDSYSQFPVFLIETSSPPKEV